MKPIRRLVARTCSFLVVTAMLSPAAHSQTLELTEGKLLLRRGEAALPVSLQAPRFVFDDVAVRSESGAVRVAGDFQSGARVELTYAPAPIAGTAALEVKVFLEWSARQEVLHKWAAYRVTGEGSPRLLKEVVLEELDVPVSGLQPLREQPVIQPPQSYPVLLRGFFAGVEFPAASTRWEGSRVILAHRPGVRVPPGKWCETRKAVYGCAPPGEERQAFERYIEALRPEPKGFTVNYNHWWSTPVRAAESDILGLMETFRRELFERHGVSFDTFCIDVGWQDQESIWEFDRKNFPQGFVNVRKAASRMGAALGIWISPSSVYPIAQDLAWAASHGYETSTATAGDRSRYFACLGGAKYSARFRERVVDMVRAYGLRSIKFDGYVFQCGNPQHGHEPGELSAEAIAEGMIATFQAARAAEPAVWLRPTCFGWNPSPWWLMYVNSAIGAFGGDAPYGRVPAPVERESYTSARDYYNLQGAVWSPIPEAAKEVLGIVHQTPDPLLNDAVMTVMRGHSFLPLYLNPKYMDGRRWEMLAELLRWARSNAPLLRHTVPLLPNSWKDTGPPQFSDHCAMPREPYGYAHWVGDQGLVVLRNPWIEPASYRLRLGAGPSRSSDAAVSVVSLYPEVRLYAKARRLGESMNVPLAPYETVVLSVGAAQSTKGMPWIQDVFKDCCRASCRDLRALIEEFAASPEAIGPSWTSPVGNRTSVARLQFEGDVDIQTPEAELLLLLEGGRSPAALLAELQINGVEKPLEVLRSDLSWAACRPPRPEHWTFLRATLQRGKASLAARVTTDVDLAALSGWVWGYAPGGKTSPCANALPTPERIPLGAVPLFAPMPAGAFSRNPIRVPRPIERIDGVYLDALTPLSAVQGWGALEKNRSVWKKPLTIVGVEYVRGLGTSSQSQIRYGLRGQYRRFQSWVGADAATRPTVTFEVWIDGKKRWESGLMNRDDPAKRCDLDVSGAEILELRVGDGGDGLVADHADWADARLLK